MMKYCFSALVLVAAAAIATPVASAQATATATGNALSVGLSYQNIDPDYGPVRASGLGVFANYDFSRYVGATVELNFQTAFSNVVFHEQTYLVGARGEYHHGRLLGYGKLLIGAASGSAASGHPGLLNAPGGYPLFAIGGGLDIHMEHHITIRAIDYEQQQWLDYHPNGLTPGVLSFGAAYRFE
jgi:hypothetical protein